MEDPDLGKRIVRLGDCWRSDVRVGQTGRRGPEAKGSRCSRPALGHGRTHLGLGAWGVIREIGYHAPVPVHPVSNVQSARMSTTEAARAANRARFARLVARPDADIDLALGALCIAADGRPDLDFEPTLRLLDALTDRVRARLDRGDGPEVMLARLHGVLYVEVGFRGPRSA